MILTINISNILPTFYNEIFNNNNIHNVRTGTYKLNQIYMFSKSGGRKMNIYIIKLTKDFLTCIYVLTMLRISKT